MRGSDRSLVCAIRGPITLITLGVLFALNNFTPYGFHQTWPVLLIVFGLLTLLRRSVEPVGPPPVGPAGYPPPDAAIQLSSAGDRSPAVTGRASIRGARAAGRIREGWIRQHSEQHRVASGRFERDPRRRRMRRRSVTGAAIAFVDRRPVSVEEFASGDADFRLCRRSIGRFC